MKSTRIILLVGALFGFAAGSVNRPPAILAQSPGPQHIPPVPSPPLYPDPPQKPMHWSIDDLHRIFAVRQAYARAHPVDNPRRGTAPGSEFPGQTFRTHSLGTNFRWTYPTPRPSAYARVMSRIDDADQHQALTDFCVFFGGSGQVNVDGVIENRVYGNKRGPNGKLIVMPGEFNGQPVKDGHTYNVKAGDWLTIPPNTPHQYAATPGEGLIYLNLKVQLGFDHPGISY